MKQKPWDRYEAALLLSYCLKIEAGDIPRKEAVDIVSNTLRKRAEVQGVEIDETFRNTNGISMQMSAIRNCYLGKDHGLAGSKLFHEMVDLYKSNHDALEQILQGESDKVNRSIWQEFLLWLKEAVPDKEKEIVTSLAAVSMLALKSNRTHMPISEISDVAEIERLQSIMRKPGALGLHSKKMLTKASHALNTYVQFLDKKADDAAAPEESQSVSVEESVAHANFRVDFSKSISYAHTKPISCKYKGRDISCAGWNALFINLTRLIYQECGDTFPVGCSLLSSSRIDIGNAEGMNYPKEIAACIGAEPEEIYFTSGGTESDNWAIKGLIEPNDKHQTITSQIEHHAVLNACNALERLGYPVVYLPVDSQGVVLSDSLSKAITEKTKLVSVMMVNNEIGTIEPIKELATIAHTHNVLFHTDAVQAVGHIPIDVNELGIDMLSSSAHKFNGPKGIGFLYIRKGTQIRPLADGGAQEFHMRAGTENIASIVGMAVALKKNCRTMQETSTKLQAMDHAFIDVLHEANVDFIRNGSVSKSPGIISVSIRNISGEMLLHRLDLKGISISTGSACDSVNTQVSHVIKAIGVPSAYAQGTIRISFGHDNQIEDAVEIAHAIAKILQT